MTKDSKKIFRSALEFLFLFFLIAFIIYALFYHKEYVPYNKDDEKIVIDDDKGFIAISYIAVDREGSPTMISTSRLEEHFEALKKNGYITITQEDIKEYYENRTPLPEKALFLMFEDGRRDTAIFSEKLMQKYNFIGTMLSYGDKFEKKDSKFLMPDDLIELTESTFWELGTNGYRLSYINVFDRYERYLGELTALEYSQLRKYLHRDYNQYLMDYIRDEDRIPKETYTEMKLRISKDYRLMNRIYTEELGYLPEAYVLMHSNTGGFANNQKVSAENEKWICQLFSMNFNREGYSFNNQKNNIYDLTRMQPQPYWYPNHLLMRIYHDTKTDIVFEDGDLSKKMEWENLKGASQFDKSKIVLTSEPEGKGLIKLKSSQEFENINISVTLTGNKLGIQTIYLRADENLDKFISVKLQNNYLYIEENRKKIYELDLNIHDEIIFQTVEENMNETLIEEKEVYNNGKNIWGNLITQMEEPKNIPIEKMEYETSSKEAYIPTIQINEIGNRKIDILLEDNTITVYVDGKEAVRNLELIEKTKGSIYLESAWGEYGYSQRNIADDVYDGVFEELLITNPEQNNEILYNNQLQGIDKLMTVIKKTWNSIINWFIRNL